MKNIFLTSKTVESKLTSMIESARENSEYRMKNYYDCVDDYSWGGACDQAANQQINSIRMVLDLLKQQEANDGYIYKTITELELQTLEGKVLSNKIVKGRFGYCFVWDTDSEGVKFCGLSKKQSTFEKKGFVVVSKHYEVKIRYNGFLTKSGYADCVVELINVTASIDTTIDDSTRNNNYALFKLKTK